MFTYFTFSVCNDQVLRFLNGPIVVSLERNYREWSHEPMAITICTDQLHQNVIDASYRRFVNNANGSEAESDDVYRRLFHAIGSLNADNIHSMGEFENIGLFLNFSGEDILRIAMEASLEFILFIF